jgi:serine/threonine-protein kinase
MENAGVVGTAGGLPPGSRLGRYQVIERIALGGMAELYLARHRGAAGYEKVVAVKRILPHLAEDETFARMFLNEAKLAASLDHSNIAHVIDFGSEGGEHFMAMEYVHGRSVHDVLRLAGAQGGVPLHCALTILVDVAAALHYAHERAGPDGQPLGLVHRDVSPSNVLVTYDGEVKLVDFGIAKATAHGNATRTQAIKGKLAYMAPEQVRGDAVDRRADVFSLGAVTYELCVGQRCFFAGGEFELINRVASGKFERPRAVNPGFPEQLEAIIVRALSVSPADRHPDARTFQRSLEAFAMEAGLRLSKVTLSDYMRQLFGEQAYPTTQLVRMAGAGATITSTTEPPSLPPSSASACSSASALRRCSIRTAMLHLPSPPRRHNPSTSPPNRPPSSIARRRSPPTTRATMSRWSTTTSPPIHAPAPAALGRPSAPRTSPIAAPASDDARRNTSPPPAAASDRHARAASRGHVPGHAKIVEPKTVSGRWGRVKKLQS